MATSLLVFLSVLAHELSHSLVAIRRGIPVRGITLFIFGGVAHIGKEADRPFTEFIVAAVGPLSSVVIGLLFLGLAIGLDGVSRHLSAVAGVLAWVNGGLAALNMLPGFPLDGGRVVRAAVWRVTRNYWRASRLATLGGRGIGLAMAASGVAVVVMDSSFLVSGLQLVVIGVFLHSVAAGYQRHYRVQERLHSYTARDLMATSYSSASWEVPLERIAEEFKREPGAGLVVLASEEGLRGVITRRIMDDVPWGSWERVSARSVMVPLDRVIIVSPEASALEVLEAIEARRADAVLVMEGGVLQGVIAAQSIERLAVKPGRTRA